MSKWLDKLPINKIWRIWVISRTYIGYWCCSSYGFTLEYTLHFSWECCYFHQAIWSYCVVCTVPKPCYERKHILCRQAKFEVFLRCVSSIAFHNIHVAMKGWHESPVVGHTKLVRLVDGVEIGMAIGSWRLAKLIPHEWRNWPTKANPLQNSRFKV